MPDISRKQLRDRLLKVAHDAQWYGWERAELGILDENNNQVVAASGRPGWAHVRISRGGGITSTVALCTRVPLIYGLKVWVGVNQDGFLSVMGIRETEVVNEIGSAASQVTVPTVATDGLIVTRRLQHALVSAMRVGGSYTMQVYIWPFVYRYNGNLKEWPGGFVDMTSYVPATSGKRRLALVGIDPDTNTATVVAGDEYPFPTTLTASHLIQIDPGTMIPLAGINLHNGMTSINSDSFFIDARPFITGTGMNPVSLLAHNVSATTDPGVDDDELDGYGIGSTWVNTLTGEIWFCVDASEGAAVWTQPTGGSSVESLDDLLDVDVSSSPPASGEALVWNATSSKWVPGTALTQGECWYPDLAPDAPTNYDDEFNVNTLDAKWTEFDEYSVCTVSGTGTTVSLSLPNSANQRTGGIYQSIALGSATDFTVIVRMKVNRILASTSGYLAAGIALMQDATDVDAQFGIYGFVGEDWSGGFGADYWSQQDTHTGTSYAQYAISADTYYYYRVIRSGGTVYVDISTDGLTWLRKSSATSNYNIAQIGIAIGAVNGGGTFTATFDFFRYYPEAHALNDVCYGRTLNIVSVLSLQERSSDPDDPDEGHAVMWMSDGTGTGDDGDIMMKITAGSVTKTVTLVDFSAS